MAKKKDDASPGVIELARGIADGTAFNEGQEPLAPLVAEDDEVGSMLLARAMRMVFDGEVIDFPSPDVRECLEDFFRANPLAPETAGLIQIKRKLKVVLLPGADPRRVLLAIRLFKLALLDLDSFAREDAEKEMREKLAQQPPRRVHADDLAMTMEPGGLAALSDRIKRV